MSSRRQPSCTSTTARLVRCRSRCVDAFGHLAGSAVLGSDVDGGRATKRSVFRDCEALRTLRDGASTTVPRPLGTSPRRSLRQASPRPRRPTHSSDQPRRRASGVSPSRESLSRLVGCGARERRPTHPADRSMRPTHATQPLHTAVGGGEHRSTSVRRPPRPPSGAGPFDSSSPRSTRHVSEPRLLGVGL
jgi:hypothetical protein